MKIIDSDNYAAAGIETMVFPGGEPHVKVPFLGDDNVLLFLKLRTWLAVGHAALLINAIENQAGKGTLRAFIPYFPGARQDRYENGACGHTLAVISKLFDCHIETFDCHSSAVYEDLFIENNWMPYHLCVPLKQDVVGIISPDKGAAERARSFRNHLYPYAEWMICDKKRDPSTGRLSGYYMPALKSEGRYIIVDDICDGGGTFNLLAEAFNKDPLGKNSQLELFVSHGIFSKGLDAINPSIEHITTTDSWYADSPGTTSRLTVLPLAQLFPKIIGEK